MMPEKPTCSCRKSMYNIVHGWYRQVSGGNIQWCPHCGDKLNADGTVESRAEVERKAHVIDIIQKHKISIDVIDNHFSIGEQEINGERVGLGHGMNEDVVTLVLNQYKDIQAAENGTY